MIWVFILIRNRNQTIFADGFAPCCVGGLAHKAIMPCDRRLV